MDISQCRQGLDSAGRLTIAVRAMDTVLLHLGQHQLNGWASEYWAPTRNDVLQAAHAYRWVEASAWRDDHFVSALCIRLHYLLYVDMQLHQIGLVDVPTKKSADYRIAFQAPGTLQGIVNLFQQALMTELECS